MVDISIDYTVFPYEQGCGVSPLESGFWPIVGESFFEGDSDFGPCVIYLDFCVILLQCSVFNFCAIYFTTKTLYTIVHFLLEKFKIFF